MKPTTELREKLGLSQQDLGEYLFVSRAQLSLYELEPRDLPAAAMGRLAELEILLNKPPITQQESLAHVKEQKKKAQKILDKHAAEQQYQQELSKRKLIAIQKAYSKKMLLLQY